MSPSASTSGCPGSERSGSTVTRPDLVDLGAGCLRETCGQLRRRHAGRPDGGARRRLHRIAVRAADRDRAGGDADHGVVDERRHAQSLQRARRFPGQRLGEFRPAPGREASTSSTRAAARVGRPEVGAHHVSRQLCDLARHLDAGGTGADHHEGQPGLPQLRVGLQLRRLECGQDPAADVECAGERLQLRRVGPPLVVAEVVVPRAACDDQRVVSEGGASAPVGQVLEHDLAVLEVKARHLGQHHPRISLPCAGPSAAAPRSRPATAPPSPPGRRAAGTA